MVKVPSVDSLRVFLALKENSCLVKICSMDFGFPKSWNPMISTIWKYSEPRKRAATVLLVCFWAKLFNCFGRLKTARGSNLGAWFIMDLEKIAKNSIQSICYSDFHMSCSQNFFFVFLIHMSPQIMIWTVHPRRPKWLKGRIWGLDSSWILRKKHKTLDQQICFLDFCGP